MNPSILMYHSIMPSRSPRERFVVDAADFHSQAQWLRKHGVRAHSVREACAHQLHDLCGGVALTFDDGYEDVYTAVFPVLQENGSTATVFLPTGHVGGLNDWEREGTPRKPLLNWDQVAEMAAAGIEFGSHTVSHIDVRHAGLDAIARELVESKQAIEDRLGTEVVSFAYPYGYFRPEMPELLANAGYKHGLLAGTYGRNTTTTSPYELHRIPIWGTDSLRQFAAKVKGWYRWRHYTIRAREGAQWAWRQLRGSTRSGD